MIALELDWPPSINNYYTNARIKGKPRRVLTSKARKYRADALWQLRAQGLKESIKGIVQVHIRLFPAKRIVHLYDMDNTLKCLLDVLQHSEIIENDNKIKRLVVEEEGTGGFVEIFIEALNVPRDDVTRSSDAHSD